MLAGEFPLSTNREPAWPWQVSTHLYEARKTRRRSSDEKKLESGALAPKLLA